MNANPEDSKELKRKYNRERYHSLCEQLKNRPEEYEQFRLKIKIRKAEYLRKMKEEDPEKYNRMLERQRERHRILYYKRKAEKAAKAKPDPETVELSVSEHQEPVPETVVLSDEKMTEWLEYVKTRKCCQCMYFVAGKEETGCKRSCRCKIGHTPVASGAACNDYDENYVNIPVAL